jgi:hypothetical protein
MSTIKSLQKREGRPFGTPLSLQVCKHRPPEHELFLLDDPNPAAKLEGIHSGVRMNRTDRGLCEKKAGYSTPPDLMPVKYC